MKFSRNHNDPQRMNLTDFTFHQRHHEVDSYDGTHMPNKSGQFAQYFAVTKYLKNVYNSYQQPNFLSRKI